MMDFQATRDPLALHLAFAARQPFVIAGFLDSTEFAALRDFVPHLVVHDSLDKMGMGKPDGAAMLAQLLDSEQEDVVEGQKNVIAIHNAGPDDLDLLATTFKQAWFASTVLPAIDVVKKYKVPVYDTKQAAWINIHPGSRDTLWARSMLAAHGSDPMALRMALKGIYLDACQLAAALLAGDVAGKAGAVLAKHDDSSSRDALVEAVTAYFGIDAAALLHGIAGTAPTTPPSPREDAIEQAVTLPAAAIAKVVSPGVNPSSSPGVKSVARPGEGNAHPAGPRDPFISEYFFLSRNVTFKKALVKVVTETSVPGREFTSPAAKYAYLRREGAWKGAMPALTMHAILAAIVAGCKDKQAAQAGAKTFQATATAFKLATADAITTLITDVLVHCDLPEARAGKQPLVAGRSWPGMDAPPVESNALITWLGQGIAKLQGFAATARGIARQRGLAGAGVPRFVPVPPPKPIDQLRGGDLVPWLRGAITALQSWSRLLGAPPVASGPADLPRPFAMKDVARRCRGNSHVH